MKILLISANTERINMPTLPLGLGCVAEAARRAGHEVRLLDLMSVAETRPVITEATADFPPDVIGISVRNIDDQKSQDTRLLLEQVKGVIADCRSVSAAPIVLGGAGYSMFPEGALEYLDADMGIQGEGESSFVSLLNRLQNGESPAGIPGLYLRNGEPAAERSYVQDLDSLPLPGADIWNPSYANDTEFWMTVQTRRGCAMDCNYCSTATIEGRRLRKRSLERVVQWMADHVEKGFRRFFFSDNTFNLPASYASELCRQLISAGLDISWRCIIYPVKLDEGLVRDMARAGCSEVSLGFESGSAKMLRIMNKRFSPGDVRLTADLFKKYGIRRTGFLLLGGPGETRETVEESFAFAESLELELLKITIGIRIYPHTQLARIAVAEGFIQSEHELLYPRFYLERDIEEWLRDTVERRVAEHPNWFT